MAPGQTTRPSAGSTNTGTTRSEKRWTRRSPTVAKSKPNEIASKTQMFTERYMVEWLLHNSLGTLWLAICKKNAWTPDASRVLDSLDARRAEWRERRERGEVALDALMPIEGELEEHWKYYVPQQIPDDMVSTAPASIEKVQILEPACGSGTSCLLRSICWSQCIASMGESFTIYRALPFNSPALTKAQHCTGAARYSDSARPRAASALIITRKSSCWLFALPACHDERAKSASSRVLLPERLGFANDKQIFEIS